MAAHILLIDDDALLRRSLAFDLDVLLARIQVVLRRTQRVTVASGEPDPLMVGDLTFDPLAHTVTLGGQPIDLPPREFDLLYALVLEAGHMVSVDDLLARVWREA